MFETIVFVINLSNNIVSHLILLNKHVHTLIIRLSNGILFEITMELSKPNEKFRK